MLETGTALGVLRDLIARVASVLRLTEAEHEHLAVLALGSDALAGTRMKMTAIADELDRWEAVTCATDFPEF